jgi:hypothetical protein
VIKNQTKLIDLETELEWKVDRRTRGIDIDNGPHKVPTQTWILILVNLRGERRFVPEKRVMDLYRPSVTV